VDGHLGLDRSSFRGAPEARARNPRPGATENIASKFDPVVGSGFAFGAPE
jgi:hypothetical protein